MKVKISALDDDSFTIVVIVSSISYIEATGKYLIAAGGYDIAGAGLPEPETSVILDDTHEFAFETTEQALQFFDWVRTANISARASSFRMLD
jgi:hypothetical protein